MKERHYLSSDNGESISSRAFAMRYKALCVCFLKCLCSRGSVAFHSVMHTSCSRAMSTAWP